MRKPRAMRGAFTLVETLLAIALLGGLLAGATVILFQVSTAWAAQAEDPVLDRHVDGLERFLRRMLGESQYPVVEPTAEQISDEKAMLSTTLPENLPWHETLATAGGAVTGRLAYADGALRLYWQTARERSLSQTKSHAMVLSPWVTSAKILIHNPDTGEWTESVPGETAAGTPSFNAAKGLRVLLLEIGHRGRTRTLQILIRSNAS